MEKQLNLSEDWLTGVEVMKILRISSRSLQTYRDKREIPFYQISRKIYYKATDVNDFLERHHIRARYQMGGVSHE